MLAWVEKKCIHYITNFLCVFVRLFKVLKVYIHTVYLWSVEQPYPGKKNKTKKQTNKPKTNKQKKNSEARDSWAKTRRTCSSLRTWNRLPAALRLERHEAVTGGFKTTLTTHLHIVTDTCHIFSWVMCGGGGWGYRHCGSNKTRW